MTSPAGPASRAGARTTPPFRADHVGSLLRPQSLLAARERHASGVLSDDELRAEGGPGDPGRRWRMQEDIGLQSATDGEFRRTSWHMDFIYQLGGINRVRRAAGRWSFENVGRQARFHQRRSQGERSHQACLTRYSRDAFRFPVHLLHHHGAAEANHPVADHGALPRRPRGDRPERLPDLEEFWSRPWRRRTRRRARGGGAGCTVPPARRHQPGVPERSELREAEGQQGGDPQTSTSGISRQINAAMPTARRNDGDHPPVPRQLPLVLGRRGRLRARGRGPVRRAGVEASSWSTTTRARAVPPLRFLPRARSWCSGW